MARSPLTLAALATSAVEGLEAASVQPMGSPSGGDFDAALVVDRDGRGWVVRIPRSPEAESEQSADLVALRALSEGVRARLPFAVSRFAGQAPVGGTRAVVCEFVPGDRVALESIDAELAASIGRAVAAIHALPVSVAADAGLPVRSSAEVMGSARRTVEHAVATGLVPARLVERWGEAVADAALWQFTPVLAHGSLSAGSLLVADGEVAGVLGWHALQVGDPAQDLQWLLAAPREGVADSAFAAYGRERGSVDRRIQHRARLLSELELARWLLHGTATRRTDIVDDAVGLMSHLVDDLATEVRLPIAVGEREALDVTEVERMLDSRRIG
ncbi:MAG: phosphotransferase [Actinomycetales bacterium]|nr:phosphotransferase [Actinomycetales bacterium]